VTCRSGCPTQDHASYGECLRGAAIRIAYTNSVNGWDATREKRWRRENDLYADAVKQGIEPSSTLTPAIRAALDWSDQHGRAYDDHLPSHRASLKAGS